MTTPTGFRPRPGLPADGRRSSEVQKDRLRNEQTAKSTLAEALRRQGSAPPLIHEGPAKVHLPGQFKQETSAAEEMLDISPSKEDMPKTAPVETNTQRDEHKKPLSSSWERVELPSNYIFYEWDDITVKRFATMDHAKITRAVRYRNLTLLLDVLASTCNRDPRELAIGDFQALTIWHRKNSYQNTTLRVNWFTRYGNELEVSVKNTRVQMNYIKKSREDYLQQVEKGFVVPTTKDFETTTANEGISEEVLYLFERAQFIDPAPLEDRIAVLKKKGDRLASVSARIERLDELCGETRFGIFDDIDAFANEYADFGVKEFATILDSKFDAAKAIEHLRLTESEENAKEIERIQADLDAGREPKPLPEEVPLSYNVWQLFPYI